MRTSGISLLSVLSFIVVSVSGQDASPYGDILARLAIESKIPIADKEYDFVIVGGSASASVLANKLSENPEWSILLLANGKIVESSEDVPRNGILSSNGQFAAYEFSPPNDYSCQAMINKQCKLIRGVSLGEDSNIDNMIYSVGNKEDYDRWKWAVDSKSWGYERVLPCFRELERANLTEIFDESYHGYEGQLHVSNVPYASPVRELSLAATADVGYAKIDYNGISQVGFSPVQAMLNEGRRDSAYHAFLEPIALSRPNLDIILSTSVSKIIIEHESNKAVGVKYFYRGQEYVAKASKEVLLAAGGMISPKLLLLSGIGPRKHLKKMDIKCRVDLPVGKNFIDQPVFTGLSVVVNASCLPEAFLEPLSSCDFDDYKRGQGRLTIPFGYETIGFSNHHRDKKRECPSLAFLQGVGGLKPVFDNAQKLKMYNLAPGSVQFDPEILEGNYFIELLLMLLHPESRGYLKLKSADYLDKLLVDPRYLNEDEDVEHLLHGIKIIKKILKSPVMSQCDARLLPVYPPDCPKENFEFDSKDYWRCLIRSLSVPARNFFGACRMGPKEDPKAVVNRKLKVYGVRQLRVVDESVIPVSLSGFNYAARYMIGLKASGFIKKRYASPEGNKRTVQGETWDEDDDDDDDAADLS
ncbi:glucose dehydrogenase [FAD, quinone]-like [Uranotaenia lowii]|uniref:glucose dehydrogenase [FAD, quinone]-like n=1 Tax=Uranotaenia lowii TaxID=190385 RepID=UPI002478AE08|nr:glucose dehydrogenase [FAD, quinone]-like [Uranotaenia lowii]